MVQNIFGGRGLLLRSSYNFRFLPGWRHQGIKTHDNSFDTALLFQQQWKGQLLQFLGYINFVDIDEKLTFQ
jgi:hypothetical protein